MSLALRFESKEAGLIEHTMAGTNPPTLPQLRDVVSRLFGTEMTILLENVPLRTSDEVLAAFEAHKVADTARRVDVLEAAIESIRCGLASSDVELKYQAIHGLWELACQPFNHRYMTYSLFEAAAAALRSPELRVQSIAAAAIWRLAEHEPTLARMNVGDLVPALLQALLPDSLPEPRSAELCVEAARDAAAAAEGAGGNSRRLRRSNTHSAPYKVLLPPQAVLDDEDEAAEPSEPSPNDLQAARAVACTGYAILEQRVWHAGGLLALLACETGKRAFQRTSVALRLLPVLEAHAEHSPAPLKAACAALLTRAAEVSPPVCKSLLEGGLEQLVRLACTSGLTDASTRQQAADLVCFALARVRLHPARASDLRILEGLPKLVGALRAASIPLLLTVQRYVRTGAPAEGFGGADASCRLLRSLIGCIWSMLGHLHRHTPLLLSSGWLWLTRALLELSPERGCHAHATDEWDADTQKPKRAGILSTNVLLPVGYKPDGASSVGVAAPGASRAAPTPADVPSTVLEMNACLTKLVTKHGAKLRTTALGMLASLQAPTGEQGHDGLALLEAIYPPPPPPPPPTAAETAPSPEGEAEAGDVAAAAAAPAEAPVEASPGVVEPPSVLEYRAFVEACAEAHLMPPGEPDDAPVQIPAPSSPGIPLPGAGAQKRRSQVKAAEANPTGDEPTKLEIHGALRGVSLYAAKTVAIDLLSSLEAAIKPAPPKPIDELAQFKRNTVERVKPTDPAAGWRACEVYGASLVTLSKVAALALRRANGIARIIELMGVVRMEADRQAHYHPKPDSRPASREAVPSALAGSAARPGSAVTGGSGAKGSSAKEGTPSTEEPFPCTVELTGSVRALHGHLAAALLTLVAHGHEALADDATRAAAAAASQPPPQPVSRPVSHLATKRPSTSGVGPSSTATFTPLSRVLLSRLVTELPLSPTGGMSLAALFWLHANQGPSKGQLSNALCDLLFEIGVTDALSRAFAHAVSEAKLEGASLPIGSHASAHHGAPTPLVPTGERGEARGRARASGHVVRDRTLAAMRAPGERHGGPGPRVRRADQRGAADGSRAAAQGLTRHHLDHAHQRLRPHRAARAVWCDASAAYARSR